jgi:hypothetical protein
MFERFQPGGKDAAGYGRQDACRHKNARLA